jgi:hypothetical protein
MRTDTIACLAQFPMAALKPTQLFQSSRSFPSLPLPQLLRRLLISQHGSDVLQPPPTDWFQLQVTHLAYRAERRSALVSRSSRKINVSRASFLSPQPFDPSLAASVRELIGIHRRDRDVDRSTRSPPISSSNRRRLTTRALLPLPTSSAPLPARPPLPFDTPSSPITLLLSLVLMPRHHLPFQPLR